MSWCEEWSFVRIAEFHKFRKFYVNFVLSWWCFYVVGHSSKQSRREIPEKLKKYGNRGNLIALWTIPETEKLSARVTVKVSSKLLDLLLSIFFNSVFLSDILRGFFCCVTFEVEFCFLRRSPFLFNSAFVFCFAVFSNFWLFPKLSYNKLWKLSIIYNVIVLPVHLLMFRWVVGVWLTFTPGTFSSWMIT